MTSENINIGMCNVYFDTANSRGLRKLGPQHSCNYNNSNNNNNHKKRETNEKKWRASGTEHRTDGATAYAVAIIEMCFWVQTDVSDLWMKLWWYKSKHSRKQACPHGFCELSTVNAT